MHALTLLFIIAAATASVLPRNRFGGVHRQKRSSEHIIRDCMLVTSEPGHYFFKAAGDDPTVCGVYLMTDPDKIIQLQFDFLDLPCNSGGLVAFVDGWELNGGYFPSLSEHRLSLEDRVSEFCGLSRPSRAFVSSQNAALVQYRVPKRSRGFSFRVSFLKNPTHSKINETEDTATSEPETPKAKRDTKSRPLGTEVTYKYRPGIVIKTEVTHQGCSSSGCGTIRIHPGMTSRTEKYETEETKRLSYQELERIVLIEQLSSTRLLKEYYEQLLGKAKRHATQTPTYGHYYSFDS